MAKTDKERLATCFWNRIESNQATDCNKIGIIWMLCRKKTSGMIRRPDTVASIMIYLCGSLILGDFKEKARMKQKKRDKLVKERDKRYSMGKLIGVDAVKREGVDESIFVRDLDGHG